MSVTELRGPYVYRTFDRAGALLYVGVTTNLKRRMGQHRSQAPWYAAMHTYRLTGPFPTAEAAAEYERNAIRTEAPAYNVANRAPLPPREDIPSLEELAAAAKRVGMPVGWLLKACKRGVLTDCSDAALLKWLASTPGVYESVEQDTRKRQRRPA